MKEYINKILFDAVKKNDYYLAKKALKEGADPNNRLEEYRITPLMNVQNDNLAIAKLLVKYGADIHAVSDNGYTALISSSSTGDIKIVNYLIRIGAKVDHKNNDGWSALHFAAKNGYLSIIRSLIRAEVDVNVQDNINVTPLMLAVFYDHYDAADLLLKNNANPSLTDKNGADLSIFIPNIKDPNKRRKMERLFLK